MAKREGESNHLPLYGPGPAYVLTIVALTVAGIALSVAGVLPTADADGARLPFGLLGAICIVGGIALWLAAVKGAGIDDGILENRLVTQGAYALVRNPIYSAFTLVCVGAILICGNLWLLALLPAFWAFLTALMKATEEKWLHDLYGREYDEYCARVNRCIPLFPRK